MPPAETSDGATSASRPAAGAVVPLPGGVVTFLLSDVEGSTRLWEGNEEEMGAAIARHYELLDAAIVLHGGVRPVEQGEGDSVVGAFARPSDAVAAALAVQHAFAEEPWGEGRTLRIRIALHTGEVQLRGQGYYVGRTVIRCARLRAIAHGGQTLVSAATRDLVAERLPDGAALRDLGTHRLKDLGVAERVFQLCHPELPGEFGPLRSVDAVANNLPAQLTSFVGRAAEVAELRGVMTGSRLVTLTGAGGCGKTRLAIHAAAEVTDLHADGVWWVELGALSDPAHLSHVVARALGVRAEESRPILDTLCERLAATSALVVLDNCEHLVAACAELAERLLGAAPGIRLLATSREPLGVRGEVTWRVPPLPEPAAVRLFVERATQVRPAFAPDASEQDLIAGICRRLDGIPLAIELAAARVRMMPPARIAAALNDRFRPLTGGARTALPRQQTLETSVGWSHDLLGADERALLRGLSAFAGGFTLEAAEAVCASEPLDPYAVLDLLTRLVDKSLVGVGEDADGRYRLLETIRLYAAQKLVEAGEAEATRSGHLAYFVALAERSEPESVLADGPVVLARLEREHDNFRAAMEWAEMAGAHEEFLRLVTALALFWELHGHMQAGNGWCARALAHDGGPSVYRARALWAAAHLSLYAGDVATVSGRAPEALAMAEEVGDEWALGRALNTLGFCQAWVFPQPEEAKATLTRSIALARGRGDNWGVGDGWKMLVVSCLLQDDYAGAAAANAELLTVARRLGNRFFLGMYHLGIGWVANRRGDLAVARRELQVALDYDVELGGAATGSCAAALLGELDAITGSPEAGATRIRRLLTRGTSVGNSDRGLYPDDIGVVLAVPRLARIALGLGAPDEACALTAPMCEELRPLGMPFWLASTLLVLSLARLAVGDDAAAEAAAIEARDLAMAIGNPLQRAEADAQMAELARRRGDAGVAEDLHHDALARRAEHGILLGVAESLEALAGLAAASGSRAEAVRLLAATGALRASLGFVRWPAEVPGHEAAVADLRAELGDEAFDAAWAAGAALSIAEAVAYASRARGERRRPTSGWASITPTELEVVKLAAKGLTNPQIGERLFISRGTVRTHLSHVFAKIGVVTRSELAAEATRRGL